MVDSFTILKDKKIVLGVTGSIAAYKAADLVRLLTKSGAQLRVVMTMAATEFVTPLTLQTLSGHPVAIELLDADQESAMGHIKLARWADWVLIAPASANSIANLSSGNSASLLSAVCLATEAPIAIAPAMNNKMWTHQSTQENLARLQRRGVYSFGPDVGEQACGEQGEGRLLAPEQIVQQLVQQMLPAALLGKRVLVTAGPTHEAIDPVRYIGNRSSGKMGFALANAAAEAGASVVLISGPVSIATPRSVERIDVESAQQMYDAVMSLCEDVDIFIACAAVADYRPERYLKSKHKKTASVFNLALVKTQDIVATVAKQTPKPFTVGFAAETEQLHHYAKTKLKAKQLDMIAANHVGEKLGIGEEMNALEVFWAEGQKSLPQAAKVDLARQLMTLIIKCYDSKINSTKNT